MLAPKYNFGAPTRRGRARAQRRHARAGTRHSIDGRGLDLERSRKVLDYLQRVWRRPVILTTVNQAGSTLELTAP